MSGRGTVHPSQSIFGGLSGKNKKKKKKRRRHSQHSQSPQPNQARTNLIESSPPENDVPSRDGEIRFVLPRSKSGKAVPFLFPLQLERSVQPQHDEESETKAVESKEDQDVNESIDDILFDKKKKKEPPSEKSERNKINDKAANASPQTNQNSAHKITARSVHDALQDSIGRRPRANSTDGELNLPRHGLCDEHVILQSHKWDMRKLHNNSTAVHPPPRGMVNLGNTCFLNATLQCLLYMPSFCHAITSLPASCYDTNKQVRGQRITMILRSLSRMAHGIISSEKKIPPKTNAIAPKSIVREIQSNKSPFRPGRQQDAHELLVHLLDAMHQGELIAAGINPSSSGWRDKLPIPRLDETTFIHRIFGGYYRSQLRCKCGYRSNTYDPFLDLALEVSKASIKSLESALGEFTRIEKLDVQNKWRCDGCCKMVCPTKSLSVFRPPLSLCVHLKRFDFCGRGGSAWGGGYGGGYGRYGKGTGSKVTKPIQFPAQLNLPLSDGRVCGYNLTGIIVHVGNSATSGHYTAFVKSPNEKGWYHMDDSYVEQVSEKKVLKQRDVYVLFYSRREVKLEFPQIPVNGVKCGAKGKVESGPTNGNSTTEHEEIGNKGSVSKGDKKASPKRKQPPFSQDSASKSEAKSSSSTKQSAKSSKLNSTPSADSESSTPTPGPSTKSPRSDSSAIKHAHEADTQSSSSDSSDSDSSTSQEKNHLVNVKKSLEYASKAQTPSKESKKPESVTPTSEKSKSKSEQATPTSSKSKKSKPTVMKSNNVEVVLSRNKKRPWKPVEATKVNSDKDNVLLGNIAVSGWEDEASSNKQTLRDLASKSMESADRSRKREMHLDKWDAGLDEGRKKKVKTKNPNLEATMRSTSNAFQHMQRDMQKQNQGKAKKFRPTKTKAAGRISGFYKMKRNSMGRKSV